MADAIGTLPPGDYYIGDPPPRSTWQPGVAPASQTNPGLPAITRVGWLCPNCKTAYSPDVTRCECATETPPLADRVRTG